jgi:hypothetical protein
MTNPTNPFNWQMPTASDLVTDLPADFETFGQAVATSMADLLGGTTGQVLSKASNTDMDFTWVAQDDANAIQNAIVDAKGDLIAATAADTPARVAVGGNYGFLQANSGAAAGIEWNSTLWTSYTPTITANTGSFTTVTGTAAWIRIGKLCVLRYQITITTNGTAGGNIKFNLPFTAAAAVAGVTREVFSTGNLGQAEINGADIFLTTITNGYPGADNRSFIGVVSYEVA